MSFEEQSAYLVPVGGGGVEVNKGAMVRSGSHPAPHK